MYQATESMNPVICIPEDEHRELKSAIVRPVLPCSSASLCRYKNSSLSNGFLFAFVESSSCLPPDFNLQCNVGNIRVTE